MGWWPFASGTQPRDIFWLSRARNDLRVGLAQLSEAERDRVLQRVNECLCTIFPQRARIAVVAIYRGFRIHPDQFILQVEVEQREQSRVIMSPHVVKIFFGQARRELEAEGGAWERFLGENEASGQVLMRVRCVRNRANEIYALVYQEAGNAIAARQVIPLEKAVIDCVRYNNPQLASVRGCINTLFTNLRAVHAQCTDQTSTSPVVSIFPSTPNLEQSLRLWSDHDPRQTDANPLRGRVRRYGAAQGGNFIDPVDYFVYLREMLARGQTVSASRQALIPPTCYGWAHGDLHGRNILVGISENEQLTSPGVFDYGKMDSNQPVLLDFVKLETELKIRALPAIFSGLNFQSRNPLMLEFDHVLNLWTRHCIDQHAWLRLDQTPGYWPPTQRDERAGPSANQPRTPERAEALCRLLAILLDIRSHAEQLLRERCQQPATWFRQYLFWLAYYGLRTVRYNNLEEAQLLSAFLSAGVASAELAK